MTALFESIRLTGSSGGCVGDLRAERASIIVRCNLDAVSVYKSYELVIGSTTGASRCSAVRDNQTDTTTCGEGARDVVRFSIISVGCSVCWT